MFTVYIITIDTETIDKVSNAMPTTNSLTYTHKLHNTSKDCRSGDFVASTIFDTSNRFSNALKSNALSYIHYLYLYLSVDGLVKQSF